MHDRRTPHATHLLSLLSALLLLSSACSETPQDQVLASAGCAELSQRAEGCLNALCSVDPSDPLCLQQEARRRSLLHHDSTDPCASLSRATLSELESASCERFIEDMRSSLSGKADAPCPPYFPWCAAPELSQGYRMEVLAWSSEGALIDLFVDDVIIENVDVQGVAYQRLELPGQGSTFEPGLPAIPVLSVMLALPPDCSAASLSSVELLDQQSFDQLEVYPFQGWLLEGEEPGSLLRDEAAYASALPYPATDGNVDAPAIWRNHKAIRLQLHPLRYHAAEGRLEVATHLRVELSFESSDGPVPESRGEASAAASYASVLPAYEAVARTGEERDDPNRVRYLIIADDALVGTLSPFVAWKEELGLKTKVTPLSELLPAELPEGKDASTLIHEYIAAQYTEHAIEYVLLVGEPETLPMKADRDRRGETIRSDFLYACVAGDDLLPELALGRLVGNEQELSRQLAKIIAYEQGDRLAPWRQRTLLVAHEQDAPGKYTACSDSIRQRAYAAPASFIKLYGADKVSNETLVEHIQSGAGVLNYRGHGEETSWWEWNGHNFSFEAQPVLNEDRTPVVFSIACLNAKLEHPQKTLAEQFMHAEAGAVAFLGATKPSWTKQNHDFDRLLFRTILDHGIRPIGQVLNTANVELMRLYAGDAAAQENAKMYIWLGDPSMELDLGRLPEQPLPIGWCNLQHPGTFEQPASLPGVDLYGRLWIEGQTEGAGPAPFVMAQVGYGPVDTLPNEAWSWSGAYYNMDYENNDEFMGRINVETPGEYAYAFRVSGDGGQSWTLCDLDGSNNEPEVSQLGRVQITARPQMSIMNASIDWPSSLRSQPGTSTGQSTMRLTIDAMTWKEALVPFVKVEIGYGPNGVLPTESEDWVWSATEQASAYSGNMMFKATLIGPQEPGQYSFAYRISQDDGQSYVYADTDGSRNGLSADKLGSLRVEEPASP
ncbi:MAG: C25 family cysteine peptidase [Myxococcota bacterium]|jgi:hypothetical protein|nr:C25 family cysteine peptidase [Myxococcota bacterium]